MKNIPNRVSIDINVKVYPIKNLEKIRLSHKSHIYKINECYLEQYKFFAIDFLKAENKVFVQILIEKNVCLFGGFNVNRSILVSLVYTILYLNFLYQSWEIAIRIIANF